MKLGTQRQGEVFVILGSLLWGLFPVITVLSYSKISPFVSLGISTFFATIFFTVIMTVRKKWHELKNKEGLRDALLTTLFIGVGYYLLYYTALLYTSPGNASIIALTELFFSFFLFHVLKKEHVPKLHVYGAILMVFGAIVVLYPNFHKFHFGDLLILAAAFIAPFGNMFQQKARKNISSDTIMFVRSFVSSIVIIFIIFATHTNVSFSDLSSSFWILFLNGIFIFAVAKLFWIEGINKISVPKAVALECFAPLVTLIFAWLLLKIPPTSWQLTAFVPMFFGILLLGSKNNHP